MDWQVSWQAGWQCVVRTIVCLIVAPAGVSHAQVAAGNAQARFRPIGTPSAVDAFAPAERRGYRSSVQQVAMQIPVDSQPMPQPTLPSNGFAFPANPGQPPSMAAPPAAGGFALPPSGGLPAQLPSAPVTPIAPSPSVPMSSAPMSSAPVPSAPPPSSSLPMNAAPTQTLPINPNLSRGVPATTVPRSSLPTQSVPGGANDYAAIAQPQLGNGFATMDNCRNITGPSTYRAAGFFGCGQPTASGSPSFGPPSYTTPATYVAPPSQIAPAVGLPPGATFAPVGIAGSVPPVLPGSPGYRPLVSFGQGRNPVQVGQGLWGQPVAYVPGQSFKNVLRYLSF